jgi:lysozyme family protein
MFDQRKPKGLLGRGENSVYIPDPMGRIDRGSWAKKSDPFGRLPEPPKARKPEKGFDLRNPFSLNQPVGLSGINKRDDVAKVETLLGRTGHFDPSKTKGPTGFFGTRLDQAVKRFQKDRSLKTDGLLNPGGETLTALAAHLGGAAERPKSAPVAKARSLLAERDDKSKSDPTFDRYRGNLRIKEGGFVDSPTDPGGPTNKGMSQKTLDKIRRQHPEWNLSAETKSLSDQKITELFRKNFYDQPQIGTLEAVQGLRKHAPKLPEQVFDAGILHGPGTAGEWLQQEMNAHLGGDLQVDGVIGSKTREALEKATPAQLRAINNGIVKRREAFMEEIVRNDPTQKERRKGWLDRARSFQME